MPNNIQTIIDKFDEIKPLGLTPDDKLVHLEEGDKRVLKAYQQQIRLFPKRLSYINVRWD